MKFKMDRLGLIFATILTIFSTILDSGRANTLTSCSNVYNELSLLQFRDYTEIPQNPVNAQDLRVCRPGMSCCTRALERELGHIAQHDFRTSLQTSTTFLKYTLSSSTVDFKNEFEDLLAYGKERIQQHFRTSQTRIAIHMNSPIEDLFGSLLDFLHGHDIDIHSTVSRFFDTLFPHVYTNQINPMVVRLDSRYRDCLSKQASIILPFGYAHHELSDILERSLTVARMFLSSIKLGLDVLNSTENMALTSKCQRALMKMRYCGQCQSLIGVPACQGYCFNVIKGCLANFMDLDLYWKDYVSTVVDLVRVSMTAEYDLQSAMFSLDSRIQNAIRRAVDNKDLIMQLVLITCGPPPVTRPTPYNDFALNNPAGNVPIAPNPDVPLDERLLQFISSLDSSKSVFRDLPGLMCSQGNMAVNVNSDCWTGETRGTYQEIIVDDGLAAQLYNPEVRLTSREHELLDALRLMDKLKHKTNLIEEFIASMTLPDDAFGSGDWYSGSGSGDYSGSGDFSGSGDDEDSTSQPHFTITTVQPKETEDFSFDPSSSTSTSAPTSKTKPPVKTTEKEVIYRPGTEKPQVGEKTRKPTGASATLHTHSALLTITTVCLSYVLIW